MPTLRFRFALISMAVAVGAAGCGTMSALDTNKQWPDQVYAGTRAAAGGHATQWDVPLSLVADTVVLPYTIPRTLQNQKSAPSTRPAG
jgi:uncharacterized protein YceK